MRPNVISIRGFGTTTPGTTEFPASPTIEDEAGSVRLTYLKNDRGVPFARFSYSHARRPVAWTLGSFALGWLGGYLAWVWIGRRRG